MPVSGIRAILLTPDDDVAAVLDTVAGGHTVTVTSGASGDVIATLTAGQDIPFGHKVAVRDVAQGQPVRRYGFPIGLATASIRQGDHVHSHNMRSLLSPVRKPELKRSEGGKPQAVTPEPNPSALRPAPWVHRLVKTTLQAAGAYPESADAMADAVTEAHLRGVETHGLRRLRPYIMRMRSGGIDVLSRPASEPQGALLRIDGRNGIGHHVAAFAAKAVSDAARQSGVAMALVRNSNHFGFAGHYATLIAAQRQIGIVTSNGQVCVAPEGAMVPLLSNNPLAIAAPMRRADCFLELDLATSVTSRQNIIEAARASALLPSGWAQDAHGNPTRDPTAALAGSLLAFGGPKGFGLLFALEALTGVLCGGAFADQVSSKEAAPDAPEGTAHLLIAIDLDMALGASTYMDRLDELVRRLAALPLGPAAPAVRYPGERRWNLRRERLRDGIPLSEAEIADVTNLAEELGVGPA
jgi:LDH2 family malate/lactate/ureidoglycolate dehydrogenase